MMRVPKKDGANKSHPDQEEGKMLKNRLIVLLAAVALLVIAAFFVDTRIAASAVVSSGNDLSDYYQRHPELVNAIQDNRLAPLDWYFRHDHATIDGDNNVVSRVNIPANERLGAVALAADGNADITFTKWVTSAGVALNSARTAPVQYNMEGVVSGDVGGGKYAGEVLSLTSSAGITKIEALYHINGGTHQFTADVFVTQDDSKGTAVIKGVVTDGWLKGAQVQGEYQVIGPCGIINAQTGPFGDLCFQGTLHILQGLSR
jgi:hypothetical protein